MLQSIEQNQGPVFAHVHLFGTHGPKFEPRERVFSKGLEQSKEQMDEFYDDSIRDFDNLLKYLYEWLEQRKLLSKTIIVVNSDHDRFNELHRRIPLIIRFPDKQRIDRVVENVQLLDLAPTLLDYLGLEIPLWMSGRSLLSDRLVRDFPIISVKDNFPIRGFNFKTPPFFNFHSVAATICNRGYTLDLHTNSLTVSEVPGHTGMCDNLLEPPETLIKSLLISGLSDGGFDIGRLIEKRK